MAVFRPFCAAFLAGTLLLTASATPKTATATGHRFWQVQGRLVGKPAGGGRSHAAPSSDVSGLACRPGAFPRLCLIVDDETQGAQIVLLRPGKLVAGNFIRLSDAKFDGKPLELDAEAVAYADGAFYVIGSHGQPGSTLPSRASASLAEVNARRHLYRIRFAAGAVDMTSGSLVHPPVIAESTPLDPLFRRHPDLARFDNGPRDDNGLAIEGLGVARNQAVIGFRGPVIDGRALALVLPLDALFGKLAAPGTLRRLDLGADAAGHPRGIRDLVAAGDAWLGIAGPVGASDPARPGNYALFRWNGTDPPALQPLDPAPGEGVPEAIMPLGYRGARVRMLLLFDGVANGAPIVVDARFQQHGSR